MALFYKDPDVTQTFTFQWDLPTGVTIASSTFTVTPAGVTIVSQSFSNATTPPTATVKLSGGTQDAEHTLRGFITDSTGDSHEQNATLRIATEIIPVAQILSSLPGGNGFDTQEAREILEGQIARLKALSGGTFPNEPYARTVVRKLTRAEIWGDILRQSGHLAADETTKEEDKAEKLLKEYDSSKSYPQETPSRLTTRAIERG